MTEIIEQGEKCLAVPLGEPGKSLARILSLKASPGWLVSRDAVEEWRFRGVTERDGALFLYSPVESGKPLAEVLALPLPEAISYFLRLTDALLLLAERQVPPFALQTDSVLFTSSGLVLFLPPAIVREIRGMRTLAKTLDSFERINHPDLKGEHLASFSLAAMLFRIIAGRFPFPGGTAEEVHEQARKLEIVTLRTSVPGLAPEVSDMVMAGLGHAMRPPPGLGEWSSAFAAWKGKDLSIVVSEEERKRALRESSARRAGSERSFRRRMFWERNWKTIAISAASVILVGIVLGSVLKGVFAPRPTRGYAPRAVVETFYSSMNSLDHQTMQACVTGKVGRQEIDEVTTLYVTSRVTLGYEGRSNIVSAADWDRRGRPPLEAPLVLYGVTDLSLEQEKMDPGPVFLAKYVKWQPVSGTEEDPRHAEAAQSGEWRTTDRVWLKKDRGDWVIFSIDRLQAEKIAPP